MRLRPFVSLLATLSFMVMAFTGIMLFIVPKGRIANWSNWELLGLTKDQYAALHVTFMVLFLLSIVLHVWLNWTPLMHYLKNRKAKLTFATKEMLVALGITVLFVGGTLGEMPPFSTLLAFEEQVKVSWEEEVDAPPYGHAELSAVKVLAKRTGLDATAALKALHSEGLHDATPESILQDLAKQYKTSPDAIYKIMRQSSTNPPEEIPVQTQGLGRMQLDELSKQEGFDLTKAIAYLEEQGVKAEESSKLKPLAESLGTTPYDLLERLKH
jgi:hypothetical protein